MYGKRRARHISASQVTGVAIAYRKAVKDMAEIKKFTSGIGNRIGHNKREIPPGKSYQNKDIKPELSKYNISIFSRGTKAETEKYRKQLEKTIFKYNRKNLIHACEFVIQLPYDCPKEQQHDFSKECLNFLKEKYLPAGEKCILSADVHRDEWKMAKDGTRISKDHMHVMFVPLVKDTKHPEYDFKLCADQLTKRAVFKSLHQNLQRYLDGKGIQATVVSKNPGDGKNIGLSVKQMKEITNKTGIVIDKPITVEEFAKILQENRDIKVTDNKLKDAVNNYLNEIDDLKKRVATAELDKAQIKSEVASSDVAKDAEIERLKKDLATEKFKTASLRESLTEMTQKQNTKTVDDSEDVTNLMKKISTLEAMIKSITETKDSVIKEKDKTINELKAQIEVINQAKQVSAEPVKEWGASQSWGKPATWNAEERSTTWTM